MLSLNVWKVTSWFNKIQSVSFINLIYVWSSFRMYTEEKIKPLMFTKKTLFMIGLSLNIDLI